MFSVIISAVLYIYPGREPMANFVSFDIPFKGKSCVVLGIQCHEGMMRNALEKNLSDSFKNSVRDLVTAEIFSHYENWKKFPPRIFAILKRAGRAKIRELTPQLSELIDWDRVRKSVPITPGACPNCEYRDPAWEKGSNLTCPDCGETIPG